MENLVQQRVSQKTLSHQPLLIVLVHLQLPIQHSARITELKSHDLEDCKKFRELDFSEWKDFLFKKGFCFNCANSNKHISKHCDKSHPQCKICGTNHITALHDPSRPENNTSQASSACTQVCEDRPCHSCARIILLKVSDQSDPVEETNFKDRDCAAPHVVVLNSWTYTQERHGTVYSSWSISFG